MKKKVKHNLFRLFTLIKINNETWITNGCTNAHYFILYGYFLFFLHLAFFFVIRKSYYYRQLKLCGTTGMGNLKGEMGYKNNEL